MKKNPRSSPKTGTESTRRLPTRDAGRGMVCTRTKLAQEFTQPHFYTPPAKKSWRAEVRLQGKLQANRGCVTLQRRGCRSNSGLEILRRTRSFPERTSSAGSVAAIFWQLGTFVYRERPLHLPTAFYQGANYTACAQVSHLSHQSLCCGDPCLHRTLMC